MRGGYVPPRYVVGIGEACVRVCTAPAYVLPREGGGDGEVWGMIGGSYGPRSVRYGVCKGGYVPPRYVVGISEARVDRAGTHAPVR